MRISSYFSELLGGVLVLYIISTVERVDGAISNCSAMVVFFSWPHFLHILSFLVFILAIEQLVAAMLKSSGPFLVFDVMNL